MKKISTRKRSYMEESLIFLPGSPVIKRRDINSYFNSVHIRLKGTIHPYYHYMHDNYGINESDGYHLYTCVSKSKKPWIVSCEHLYTERPFFQEQLLKENCLKILTISEWLYEEQFLKGDSFMSSIKKKLEVFKPTVQIRREKIEEVDREIKFIFVGRDFFRKGGLPMLRTFEKLKFKNWKLTIVSQLSTSDVPVNATLSDLKEAKYIIERNGNIRHIPSLDNKSVLEEMNQSHIGLCPTYLDTYGISVLEFFSCGLPVISSNVLAMTEMVDDDRGWIANLPIGSKLKNYKRVDRSSDLKRNELNGILEKELLAILSNILSDPAQIIDKSKNISKYLQREHDPAKGMHYLQNIYGQF